MSEATEHDKSNSKLHEKYICRRLLFLIMYFSAILLSCITFIPQFRGLFVHLSTFCDMLLSHGKCDLLVFQVLLFRLYFGIILYFVILSLVDCQPSVDANSKPQFLSSAMQWTMKCLILIFLMTASIFIPEGVFGITLMHFGWVGSFFFILIELVIIVDFAKFWNQFWVEQMEISLRPQLWYFSLLFLTAMIYTLSIAFAVYFFFIFTPSSECLTNKFFISFNLFLCTLASFVSIHPRIREAGLLQAGLVLMYTMYLTWSSLINMPNKICNPTWDNLKDLHLLHHPRPVIYVQMIVDIIVMGLLLFYLVLKVSKNEHFMCDLSLAQCSPSREPHGPVTKTKKNSFFFLVLILGALYSLMIFTDWHTMEGTLGREDEFVLNIEDILIDRVDIVREMSHWVEMCIKMTACLAFILLYVWTLVAPVVMTAD